jgi:hypothetical protein
MVDAARLASFVVRVYTVHLGGQAPTAKVRPDLRYGTGIAKHAAEDKTAKTTKVRKAKHAAEKRKPSFTADRCRSQGSPRSPIRDRQRQARCPKEGKAKHAAEKRKPSSTADRRRSQGSQRQARCISVKPPRSPIRDRQSQARELRTPNPEL